VSFRLAHFSDPHLNPLPAIALRDLMGKRLSGYANWLRSRRRVHDMVVLKRLLADIRAAEPDHIACTGDVTHLGLPAEFPPAAQMLRELGPAESVSFVPGNHDAYAPASLPPMDHQFAAWTRGDDGRVGYPWLKVRNGVALIGVNSAVPTGLFMAWGRVGAQQIDKTEQLLAQTGRSGLKRIVLIHHPPHVGGAKAGRNLKDASAFEAMVARVGAELVLHGHNHRTSLSWINGPGGARTPVVGVASASLGAGGHGDKAGWHLVSVPDDGGPMVIERRGFATGGTLATLQRTELKPG
jgi:3',5'-cyclic AMP phosphodiesterase CpdA